MSRRESQQAPQASWPFRLPASMTPEEIERVRNRVEELAANAQYGWGHTIDFGPFTKEGVLKDNYLTIAGRLMAAGWWPRSLEGKRVADIGCHTGALSLLMASQGAAEVIAVDEIPEHVAQCAYLCEVFKVDNVRPLLSSLYQLPQHVGAASVDVVILSGVLYHLSDMLVGLLVIRELLKLEGTVLIESNAVADDEHSYANFGRFAMGMWWQPTTLCIREMCQFMGLDDVEVEVYTAGRCLARARKVSADPIPFRRGLNYQFRDLRDAVPRSLDPESMSPR